MKRGKVKGKFALHLASFLLICVTKRQEGYSCLFILFVGFLCDFGYLSLVSFVARFKVEYFSWVIVYPFFYVLYLLLGDVCKVCSFWYQTSNLSIDSFVCSTFP